MNQENSNSILDIRDLKMYFPVTRGLLRKKVAEVKAVDGVTFKVNKGETLGLVGESGCGKTTIGRCVLRVYRPTGGRIIFRGEDISYIPKDRLKHVRSKMALIFQDPYSSLDPRQKVGDIVGEPLLIHKMVKNNFEYNDRVERLFHLVGLDSSLVDRYPHELSGGQRQRVGIARSLAIEPSLIVCDEPISALDVSIQAQIINLLKELQDSLRELTYLFIAHDLSVVQHVSDRIAVMYLGRIVEITRARTLYHNPLHPYTRALRSAVPIADPFVEESRERIILKGEVPTPLNPPEGCTFYPRCYQAIPECRKVIPPLRNIEDDHEVACIRI